MTASVEVVRVCVLGLLVVLTLKSFRRSRGARGQAARWLTASFAVLAAVTFAGVMTPQLAAQQGSGEWKLTVCLLLLFPYCLGRFTAAFAASPPSRSRHWLFAGLTLFLVLATLAMPPLGGAPRRTIPYTVYALAFMAEWTLLSVLSAWSLWRAGRGHPAVVRRRMRTLSLGSSMVNVALLVLGSAPPALPSVQLVVQLLGMVSAWLFFVGFAPPAALRVFWRQPALDLFHAAEGQLVAALDPAAVARVIVPQAVALLGGTASFMTDQEGHLLASHGIEPDEVDRVVAELSQTGGSDRAGVQEPIPGLLALQLRGGWLVVAASPATPLFRREELRLFEALGHSAELALERVDLFERDRAGRRVLEERERQLAQAQRLAHLGSWEWHFSTGRVVWSEEMYRLYELEPAALEDAADYRWFYDRSHPEDQGTMEAAVREAVSSGEPFHLDHRLVLPDGRVRWLHSRGRVVFGDDGSPVSLQGTAQDITATKEAEQELAHQALHDPLTGLPNRALLMDRLDQAASRARRRAAPLTVLFLDLDRFKVVNDGLGHGAGDELLRVVAHRLVEAVRPEDTVARFGGDEFVVLCETLRSEEEAAAVAARVAGSLSHPVAIAGRDVAITASIGIVVADPTFTSPEELLRDADTAMYEAKERGRARYEVFDAAARRRVMDRLDTDVALHQALERGEFRLWYQPEVSLEDGRIVGLEALLRWEHPELGLQLPAQFLHRAEETGLILPIGEWALDEACRQAQAVRSVGSEFSSLVMWVNLSARQLAHPDLVAVIARILAETATDPGHLGLEITETVLTEDVSSLRECLRRLRRLGLRLAIDDFGTGFSSLSWLRQFPVDVLKVDRSFVDGMTDRNGDRAIVDAVVRLARSLDMIAVAEGVESPDDVEALRTLGCHVAQGFYFSKPMDGAALVAALARGGAKLPWASTARNEMTTSGRLTALEPAG